jgi:hypothetical protein
MKRVSLKLFLAVLFAVFSIGASAGPSAKFAATYGYGPSLGSLAVVSDSTVDAVDFDLSAGFTLATIKVPQDKELLVGVSANVGLVTDTSIKGKNGGAARSVAGAGAGVVVFAVPVDGSNGTAALAEPGAVVLSARVQVLDATLGGVIESCTDFTGGTDINGLNPGDDGYIDTPDGTIDVLTECIVSDEEIGLILGTMAAHHFNFVLPNMDQGEYNLVAFFVTGALAAVDINELSVTEGGSVSASAFGAAFIGKHMVTVQQVRAAKGGIIDAEIVEL